MKVYAILKESFIDEEFECEILDNECFTNEMNAYDKMLEEAQLTVEDWNNSPNVNFRLDIFPKVHSCSICGENESDFTNYYVVPMEIK